MGKIKKRFNRITSALVTSFRTRRFRSRARKPIERSWLGRSGNRQQNNFELQSLHEINTCKERLNEKNLSVTERKRLKEKLKDAGASLVSSLAYKRDSALTYNLKGLIELLNDRKLPFDVRRIATEYLIQTKPSTECSIIFGSLRKNLHGTRDPFVRSECFRALAKFVEYQVVPREEVEWLIKYAEDTSAPSFKKIMLETLRTAYKLSINVKDVSFPNTHYRRLENDLADIRKKRKK